MPAHAHRVAAPRSPTVPVRLAVPGRILLLVAGMPGAGKSTLVAGLSATPGVIVLDSDVQRGVLRRALPDVPYRYYRPLVHLLHRLAVLRAAASAVPTVVVHLPATRGATRAVVALLATFTGRIAHLLWLHVEPADALRSQSERGRIVPAASFAAHAERAVSTTALLLAGAPPKGWRSVTVLDRAGAGGGLCLDTGESVGASK